MMGFAIQQRRVAKQTGELLNLVRFFFLLLQRHSKEMTQRDRAVRGQGQVVRTDSVHD